MTEIELKTLTTPELREYYRIILNCLKHHYQWSNTLDNKHIRDYYRAVLTAITKELSERKISAS
jgi:hypothetical protein